MPARTPARRRPLRHIAVCLALLAAQPGAAASPKEVAALHEALQLDRIIAIMRKEGMEHGEALAVDMFPQSAGGWENTIRSIYDEEAMRDLVTARFAAALEDTDAGPLLAFFGSGLGQRIISLEVEAREAMLAPDVEAVAEENWAEMLAGNDPRVPLLERFLAANDLVESNVTGSMNASYAFYQGLSEGAAFDGALSEEEILADVWAQEDGIRIDTEDWVYSYIALAYGPLSDAEIDTYTELSLTEEGQDLNRALFDAFDAMYVSLSRALGRAAAARMAGTDL